MGADENNEGASVQFAGRLDERAHTREVGSALMDRAVPRPGIEPGLEAPETSVMSFSLPGHNC